MTDPTIARVAAITVRVPVAIPTAMSTRALDHRDYILVAVTDSDGATGTGYTYAGTSAGAWVTQAVNELLAPHAVGKPARGINELYTQLAQEFLLVGRRGGLIRALSALDIALWDLLGPDDRPLAARPARLGPQLRPGVRERWLLPPGRRRAEHPRRGRAPARTRFRRLQDEGRRRCRCARTRHASRRRARRSARPGGSRSTPTTPTRSVAEAIKAMDAFAPHDIWWFEEPLVPDDVDGHAQLAARGPIPIATGEIEATAWGFGHLLRARAAHIHQTDACVCGGVGEWLKAANAAAAFGVQVAPHWHHNLHAQLAAAVSNGLVVEHFALEEGVYNFEELLEPATRMVVTDGAIAAQRPARASASATTGTPSSATRSSDA